MEIFDYDNILLLPANAPRRAARCDHLSAVRPASLPAARGARNMTAWTGHHQAAGARGLLHVMHRFDLDSLAYARAMRDKDTGVMSVGVKPADHELVTRLATEGVGADYLTIDIARPCQAMQRMIAHIRTSCPALSSSPAT